jgi:hypothetical protein
MKRRAQAIVFLIAITCLAISCSKERPTGLSAERFKGNLKITIVDSFHLNDSTSSFSSTVSYSISHESGYFNNGTLVIDSTSNLGMSYVLNLDSVPAGDYGASFTVSRPFVILDRKDDTGEARFSEIKTIAVPTNSTVALPPVEIWAYQPNRLVVYFEPNVEFAQADTILREAGARILRRSRSLLNDAPLYRISTADAGTEVEFKPIAENLPGVRAVYYDIFGHSYF